jgi:hypothetical protein
MKKVFVSLALLLSLAAIPVVFAARSDSDDFVFQPLSSEMSPARDIAALGGLERENGYRTLVVGAAVPGGRSAECSARLLDAGLNLIGEERFTVDAGSSGQIDFASQIGPRVAMGAQVSCNQPFYAYGAAASDGEKKVTWAENVGPNGPCHSTISATEVEPGLFVAGQEGIIHNAVKGKEKGIVCVHVPRNLAAKTLVLEWDVIPGPWNKRQVSGNHGLMFLHRGRFRSNTVSNVNAFGPGKGFIKMAQNVEMPPLKNTNAKLGVLMQQGTRYHLRYTYNSGSKKVLLEVFEAGTLIRSTDMETAPKTGKFLAISQAGLSPKGALFSEFGHNRGQHPPEMDSPGWIYGNLRIAIQE